MEVNYFSVKREENTEVHTRCSLGVPLKPPAQGEALQRSAAPHCPRGAPRPLPLPSPCCWHVSISVHAFT